jgi:hypothetical protein
MPDGPFYPYIGLLILSGVLLAVLAGAGFGQARGARLVDALFAAGFLGYAAYLWIADPDTVEIFFYAFAVPVFAVINIVRSRGRRRGAPLPAPVGYAPPAADHPRPEAAFAPPTAGTGRPPAPEGFSSAAALFTPPKQEARPEVPAVDPGSYRGMPSGLAGHDVHEQALPSARPSGLPRRAPTYAEPAASDQPWRSDLTQQFRATPAEHSTQLEQALPPTMGQHQFEPDPAGQAAPEQQHGRHGYSGPAERAGRHWRQDPEPFDQHAYYPAHGEQPPGDGGPAYPREPGRHEQQETHPADWPPFPR